MEDTGHTHDRQMPAAVGPAGGTVGVHCSESTLQHAGKAALEGTSGEVDSNRCLPTGGPRLPAPASTASRGNGSVVC